MLVDSTTGKTHEVAAGQKSIPAAEAPGRSRGDFSCTPHAVVDAFGNAMRLTGGQQADCSQLSALPDSLSQSAGKVVANKAYDPHKVLTAIARQEAEAIIPPKINRVTQRAYNKNLYAYRNKVWCFFSRLKEA